MKKYKQYEIPNNSKVKLKDGRIVKFLSIDGMYARWDFGGVLKIGNYESFIKDGDVYKVFKQ